MDGRPIVFDVTILGYGMNHYYAILLTLLFGFIPRVSFSIEKHDLSASCMTKNTLFSIDDGPAQVDDQKPTLLMYKSADNLNQEYKFIALPVSIRDPEGLACENDDIYIVSGEYDNDEKDDFLTSHFKILNDGQSFRAELVKQVPTLDIIKQELINIFGKKEADKILKKNPKEGGLNIEGLALSNGILSYGLRSPLKDEKAIIITANVHSIETTTSSYLFNLKNKGIRGLDSYLDVNYQVQYVAIDGPTDKSGNYSLWHLSQLASDKINEIGELCRPESVVYISTQNTLFVQSEFSGDACEGSTIDHLTFFYQY